jgi:hypothetical protein
MGLAPISGKLFCFSAKEGKGSDGQFDVGSEYIRHEAEIFFSYTV